MLFPYARQNILSVVSSPVDILELTLYSYNSGHILEAFVISRIGEQEVK